MGNKSYSKGISWINDCRIPFEGENTMRSQYENKVQVGMMAERPNIKFVGSFNDDAKQGRFPANILVSDDMLNDGVISKSGKDAYRRNTKIDGSVNFMGGTEKDMKMLSYDDKGSNSRYYDIDKWFNNLIDV